MKQRRSKSGMVLVTVIMIVMVMSTLLIAILSQNLSQASVTQAQIDEIKAKQLALGAFWKAQAVMSNTNTNVGNFTETMDGKIFTVTVGPRPAAGTQYSAAIVDYPQ